MPGLGLYQGGIGHPAIFMLQNTFFDESIKSFDSKTSCSTNFHVSDHERTFLILRVTLPRKAKGLNHTIAIVIPAKSVVTFNYTDDTTRFQEAGVDVASLERTYPNGISSRPCSICLETKTAYIIGTALSVLATKNLSASARGLIRTVREVSAAVDRTIKVDILIRNQRSYMAQSAEQFSARLVPGTFHDPITDWFRNPSNPFNMDNLVVRGDRPNLCEQGAKIVFIDKMAYMIPQIYGNLYEEEYRQFTVDRLNSQILDLTVIESPIALNPHDRPAGMSFNSTARSYIGFINFREKEHFRIGVGDRFKVHLNNSETRTNHIHRHNVVPSIVQADGTNLSSNEQSEDRNVWFATVIDTTEATPMDCLTIILQRARETRGPHRQGSLVDTPLPTVNFRAARSSEHLMQMIKHGPKTKVSISLHYSQQGFEDELRCANELWHSDDEQKQRISEWLLCHSPDQSPLRRVNLLALKGISDLDLTGDFNSGQKESYSALKDTPEVTLLHGPFGTGKTTFLMSTAMEIISNPSDRNQILYVVESNKAVDDVAMRLTAIAKKAGLGHKKIIRAHSVNSENIQLSLDSESQVQLCSQASDNFVTEFATLAYLAKLTTDHRNARASPDPRRVLHDMSLAHVMNVILQTADNLQFRWLHELLEEYGGKRFYQADLAIRAKIKVGLNDLMGAAISEADIIVCTVAACADVNLATSFHPVVVYIDEAARLAELKSLIPLALYRPRGFVLAGDHRQMKPTVLSDSRKRNFFHNPFESQVLLSLFERLMLAGQEYNMLTVQHRCKGDIPEWVSSAFYHGRVTAAPLNEQDQIKLDRVRQFCKELGTKNPTNRFGVNVQKSIAEEEYGGTSYLNDHEVNEIIADVKRIRQHPHLKDMSVGIISFYKAQVNILKTECHDLPGVFVLDGNESISSLSVKTVDASLGSEYDIVLLSFVQDDKDNNIFVSEPHRLAVALTRARWLLGIYSNWQLVESANEYATYRYDHHLVNLFKDLASQGHIIDREVPLMKCYHCQELEHTSGNCRRLKGTVAESSCYECRSPNHSRQNCPRVRCSRCHDYGHSAAVCPAPKEFCFRCYRPGHYRRECRKPADRRTLFDFTPVSGLAQSLHRSNITPRGP